MTWIVCLVLHLFEAEKMFKLLFEIELIIFYKNGFGIK